MSVNVCLQTTAHSGPWSDLSLPETVIRNHIQRKLNEAENLGQAPRSCARILSLSCHVLEAADPRTCGLKTAGLRRGAASSGAHDLDLVTPDLSVPWTTIRTAPPGSSAFSRSKDRGHFFLPLVTFVGCSGVWDFSYCMNRELVDFSLACPIDIMFLFFSWPAASWQRTGHPSFQFRNHCYFIWLFSVICIPYISCFGFGILFEGGGGTMSSLVSSFFVLVVQTDFWYQNYASLKFISRGNLNEVEVTKFCSICVPRLGPNLKENLCC